MSRYAFPVVLLLAAAGALVWVLLPADRVSGAEAEQGRRGGGFRVPVTTAGVRSGTVQETVELVGDVVVEHRATLAFERAGRVVAVHADVGRAVEEGALLAELDQALLTEQRRLAAAALAEAEVRADLAEREARRARETGADLLSESVIDQRAAESAAAEHRVARAEADLARLDVLLAQGRLAAPFDGVVTERTLTRGSYATAGGPVLEMLDLGSREVWLEIPPDMAAGIAAAGDPPRVTLRADERPGWSVETTLARLVPSADRGTRTFRGVVELEGDVAAVDGRFGDGLLPGLFVRAQLVRRTARGALVVPTDAVIHGPGGPAVAVVMSPVEDGPPTAEIVPVEVLAATAFETAVRGLDADPAVAGPLVEGAEVVLTGAEAVFPGAPLGIVPSGGDDASAVSGS